MSTPAGIPAGASPPVPPEAFDSTYGGHPALIFTAIFLVIQIAFVALRYIAKWVVNVRWGYDDILVLISLFLQIAIAGIAFGKTPLLSSSYPAIEESKY